ncbi:MAG: hypothetical protein K6F33_10910 [Bacteroidales bacterium]|nr:hypothetical protein [Bacteroidales bacterium]
MKHILLFLWAAMIFCSCFNTRFDDTEEKRLQRIRDSIRTDSINAMRNKPDTTLALYKRTAVCDGKQMVVFDRVNMLSGEEAVEYAKRHKRFGNNLNVVVNNKVTLETLPMDTLATILLLNNDGDSLQYYNAKIDDIAEGITAEELMQIVVLHRSIVYLKHLPRKD